MAKYTIPMDWFTDQKLRASWLNREISENLLWLKDREFDMVTVRAGQAANLNITATTDWYILPDAYRLRLFLPDTCHVLLTAQLNVTALGADHLMWLDWVRDGSTWLSTGGSKPTPPDTGLVEIGLDTIVELPRTVYWWDTDIPAGEHTWDLAVVNQGNSVDIEQINSPWQLRALGW